MLLSKTQFNSNYENFSWEKSYTRTSFIKLLYKNLPRIENPNFIPHRYSKPFLVYFLTSTDERICALLHFTSSRIIGCKLTSSNFTKERAYFAIFLSGHPWGAWIRQIQGMKHYANEFFIRSHPLGDIECLPIKKEGIKICKTKKARRNFEIQVAQRVIPLAVPMKLIWKRKTAAVVSHVGLFSADFRKV